MDGLALLGAEALAPVAELLQQAGDLLGIDGVGAVRDGEVGDVAKRVLGAERVPGREDRLVRHAGLGLDAGLRIFEGHQLVIAERDLAPAPHGLAVHGAGERILQLLHDVRDVEDRLHLRELLGDRDDLVMDFGDALVSELLDLAVVDTVAELRDIDDLGGFLQETLDVLLGRGAALGFPRARRKRGGRHLGRVGERVLAEMLGDRGNELGAPLAPCLLQVRVHLADAAELALGPVALHGDAEAFLHDVGEMAPECGTGGLLPGIERVAVQRPELSIAMRPDGIEDRRMDMQLRVAFARGAVQERRRQHVAGLDAAIHPCLADARGRAMPEYGLVEGAARGVDHGAFDLLAVFRSRRGRPVRRYRLVGREGDVEAGRTLFGACVLHERCAVELGRVAAAERVELLLPDEAAVLQVEEAGRVVPLARAFLAAARVVALMRRLALDVVGRHGHLGDRRYHP